MSKTKDTVLGVIMNVGTSIANLFHLIFTVLLAAEQGKTGWGYGTDVEMAVIFPWMIEIMFLPLIIFGIVYFLICRKTRKNLYLTNLIFFGILVFQYVITNIFIFC